MKKIVIPLVLCIAISQSVAAQTRERFTIKAGEDLREVFPPEKVYRFPQFTEGEFLLKDGTNSRSRFNYNLINGEMQYVNAKGDTLAVGVADQLVHIIVANKYRFIYNKGYLEILEDNNSFSLAKKVSVSVERERKGGYGQPAPAASVDNVSNLVIATGVFRLSHDVAVSRTTSYFFLNEKNNLQPATRKILLKWVAKAKHAAIDQYITQNKTDFNKEEDLIQLVRYIGSL